MYRFVFIGLTILFLVPSYSLAHRGGVDSSGGHFDRNTGQYHCHRTECEELVIPQPNPADTIRIATFNIKVFGRAKAGRPAVMATLASIIRNYDIVAIQEFKDSSGRTPVEFLQEINSDGSQYEMRVSQRTGLQPDDSNFREQYGFFFNTQTILSLDPGRLFDDSANDFFQREPFMARFRARGGTFDFVLITIHTQPDAAVEEIDALFNVVEWARGQYPGEDDYITLGDFNAGCDYASEENLDDLELSGAGFVWVVPHTADTNVSTTRECAYDRIVITETTQEEYLNRWGVDEAFTDNRVSDHWPVWAEFSR